MRKSKVITLNQLNIKNNKISKDNFEKIIKEKICGGTLQQSTVFKKNYEAKFSTNSI
jgi:hypothetical protein